jgi:hypothetical protein
VNVTCCAVCALAAVAIMTITTIAIAMDLISRASWDLL